MNVFERAYEGRPSWEIGRPQGAVIRLAEAGRIVGRVLDVGCGTGQNSLHVAALGHPVVGIDIAAAAIERARGDAVARGIQAEFLVLDVFQLAGLGRTFDTIIDIGLFHTLQPADRMAYAASLRSAMAPAGRCFLVCWNERNDFGYGPQRVTRGAIRSSFARGWRVEGIEAETLETRLAGGSAHAWLARLQPRRRRAATDVGIHPNFGPIGTSGIPAGGPD